MIIEDLEKREKYIEQVVSLYVLMVIAKFYNKITDEQLDNFKESLEQLNQIFLGRKILDGI